MSLKETSDFTNKKGKKKKWFALVAFFCVVIFIVSIVWINNNQAQEVVYKETTVQYGDLMVGITESGTVDIGTVEQTFELDMSALQRANTGNSGTGSSSNSGSGNMGGMGSEQGGFSMGGTSAAMGGGMDMFSQILNMAGGTTNTNTGTDSSLTISKVCVSVGQQIAEGDVLYELEQESVSELEEQLQSDIEKAKADLDAVYADQKLSKQTAEYTYETSTAYGSYAQTEYNITVQTLQSAVTEAEKELAQEQETLNGYQELMTTITASYEDAKKILDNCNWSLENTNKSEDLYGYVYYFELVEEAQATVDSIEQKKEQLEQKIEQSEQNIVKMQTTYQQAKRNLEQGLLSAQQTLELRQLAYDTAQETYDIAMAYLEEDTSSQESIYHEAQEKWEEYSSHITGNTINSQYNGVVTSVDLAEGDTITTGSVMITLYDMDNITMTVTIYEEDMTNISLNSTANITFTAYPDTIFSAVVTEISDAQTDSSGNVTYDITVTVQGDVSGLFQGMTGDITFVTEESRDVIYVSKRAVTTEEDNSYVLVKKEDGSIEKRTVKTGFTDGIYIEIVEGLEEGEIVLYARSA